MTEIWLDDIQEQSGQYIAVVRQLADPPVPFAFIIRDPQSLAPLWPLSACRCFVDLMAFVQEASVYESEAAFSAAGSLMAPTSMIPTGMFSRERLEDGRVAVAPRISFSGRILDATPNPNPSPDTYDWRLLVRTLGMDLNCMICWTGPIEPGYWIHVPDAEIWGILSPATGPSANN